MFVYNPFPCIFATKACINLIMVTMDRYWSSNHRHINKQNPSRGYVIMTSYVTCKGENQHLANKFKFMSWPQNVR